jgi:hypothetical protein
VIPTLLLVGLAMGILIHDRGSLGRSIAVGAVVSVLWGAGVGVADASAATAVGGTALGMASVGFGAAVGAAVRSVWNWLAWRVIVALRLDSSESKATRYFARAPRGATV